MTGAALALTLTLATQAGSVPLEQGATAPFAGQLLDLDTAARLVVLGDTARRRAELAVRQAQAHAAIERQRAEAFSVQLAGNATDMRACDAALRDCRRTVAVQRGWWWTCLGWGATGLLVGGAVGLTLGLATHGR